MKKFKYCNNIHEFQCTFDLSTRKLSSESLKKLNLSRILNRFVVKDEHNNKIHVTLYRNHVCIVRTLYDMSEFAHVDTQDQLEHEIILRYNSQFQESLNAYRAFIQEFAAKKHANIEDDEKEKSRIHNSSNLVREKAY